MSEVAMWDKDVKLARIAERQFQVFAGAQAVRAGFSRHSIRSRTKSGLWIPVLGDSYVTAGTPLTLHQRTMAAALSIGAPVAVSHLSALALWDVGIALPEIVHVSVPWTRNLRPDGIAVKRTRRWTPFEIVRLGPIPIVNPYRALLDASPLLDEVDLEGALDAAHLKGLIDVRRFVPYLEGAVSGKVRGASRLLYLVGLRDPDRPIESWLESHLFNLLRRSGLPRPVPQYWVTTRQGDRRRIDFAYPDKRVALHGDSLQWHGGRKALEDDRIRDFELIELGWERINLTWSMIQDRPADVACAVGSVLGLEPTKWRSRA